VRSTCDTRTGTRFAAHFALRPFACCRPRRGSRGYHHAPNPAAVALAQGNALLNNLVIADGLATEVRQSR
jgi:hypothetical protein